MVDGLNRTSYNSVVGKVLARLREQRGLEQDQLAAQLGINQSSWSRVERGDTKLTLETLASVSDVFGLRTNDIVREIDMAVEGLNNLDVEVVNSRSRKVGDAALILLTGAALGILVSKVLKK